MTDNPASKFTKSIRRCWFRFVHWLRMLNPRYRRDWQTTTYNNQMAAQEFWTMGDWQDTTANHEG